MASHPKHHARKRFGQHFLTDETVLDRLNNAINPQADDLIVEIGPGLGALTDTVLPHLNHLHVVELDRDLVTRLQHRQDPKLTIHESDALEFNFAALANSRNMRIIGNLPYNISTPLIFHLFNSVDLIQDMHFMLQKEVVKRLCAQPNDSLYGRISVMAQYYCQCDSLFDIGPEAFDPPPKVDSAIVRMIPHQQRTPVNVDRLSQVVFQAFNQRRKTLSNTLKKLISAKQLEQLGINPKARAQELSVENFVTIVQSMD